MDKWKDRRQTTCDQKTSLEILVQVSFSDHMPCNSSVAEFLFVFVFFKDEQKSQETHKLTLVY